jgi:hypothetical protein
LDPERPFRDNCVFLHAISRPGQAYPPLLTGLFCLHYRVLTF